MKRSVLVARRFGRPARVLTAAAILAGATLSITPALAAPPTGGQPPGGQAGGQSSAASPPTQGTLPDVPVTSGQLPPTPPPNDVGPPAPEPPAPPQGGFKQSVGCIRSNVQLPLTQKPWPQDLLQINRAHDFATGADQTVAVIDTGVSAHDYLNVPRLIGGGDYVVPSEQGLHDCDGHGTEVAGIIAANSGGAVGFDGMAPDASIISIRQTSKDFETNLQTSEGKSRTAGTVGTLASAVVWALHVAAQDHAHLAAINISLTSCITNPGVLDNDWRKLQAAINLAVSRGTVVVAAAGNKSQDANSGCVQDNDSPDPNQVTSIPIPPWLGDNVLTVASVNQAGDPSDFSISGPWVKVAAPGERLISLDPAGSHTLVNQSVDLDKGGSGGDSGGGQQQQSPLSGTSFAAPYVSGLVALIKEKYPNLSAQQVMRRIEMTAQHPGGPTGRNNKVGYGMIDPVAALTATIPQESGAQPEAATPIPAQLPPPYKANSTAMIVALAGGGTALALLLITWFVLHSMKRVKDRRQPS